MSNSTPSYPKLNNYNYKSWSGDMQAWLMSKELWMLVDNQEPSPEDSDKDAKLKWQKRAQKAAGELFLSVEQDEKSHFHGILSNPITIWTTLRDVHMSKKPGARFNAYDSLFSIRKQQNESLQSLCARIDASMQTIQDLRPTPFTLKEMDDELHSMALIRSLPDEYKSLSQSLMLMDGFQNQDQGSVFGRGDEFTKEGRANHCRNIGYSSIHCKQRETRSGMRFLRFERPYIIGMSKTRCCTRICSQTTYCEETNCQQC